MRVTRRFWTLASTSGLFVLLAVGADRPTLLAGGAGVAGLLLAAQWRFTTRLRALDEGLVIEQTMSRTHVRKNETATLTLEVSVPDGGTVPARVSSSLPPTARSDGPLRVDLGDARARTQNATELSFPVVGTVTIDGVTVEARDEYGLFEERLSRGQAVTVTVEPRQPRDVHVGQGGERTASTLGGHRSGQIGQGVDPAEIREYVPGDAVSDMDWKATARLADPHVREYEVETDRRTLLFVDHRESLGLGTEGETMLAYQREVALALTDAARDLDDPLGLYAVGDRGTTEEFDPSTSPRQYDLIRSRLLDLVPTGSGPEPGHESTRRRSTPTNRKAARLGDDSRFETTLRPYLTGGSRYRTRIADRPLFRTMKVHLTRLEGSVWSVVFTDDTNRAELRDAIDLARRGDGHALVFLTPRVLFEPGGLTDTEQAYDKYSDFEQFRRDLNRLQDVTAYEVGPGDRIDALLDTRRRARQ